jgi:hypothetical protein
VLQDYYYKLYTKYKTHESICAVLDRKDVVEKDPNLLSASSKHQTYRNIEYTSSSTFKRDIILLRISSVLYLIYANFRMGGPQEEDIFTFRIYTPEIGLSRTRRKATTNNTLLLMLPACTYANLQNFTSTLQEVCCKILQGKYKFEQY